MPAFTSGSQTKELLKQLFPKPTLNNIKSKQQLMLTECLLCACTILIIYMYQLGLPSSWFSGKESSDNGEILPNPGKIP